MKNERKLAVFKSFFFNFNFNTPNLSLLNDKRLINGNFAIVGVPCQMQALLKSKLCKFQFRYEEIIEEILI